MGFTFDAAGRPVVIADRMRPAATAPGAPSWSSAPYSVTERPYGSAGRAQRHITDVNRPEGGPTRARTSPDIDRRNRGASGPAVKRHVVLHGGVTEEDLVDRLAGVDHLECDHFLYVDLDGPDRSRPVTSPSGTSSGAAVAPVTGRDQRGGGDPTDRRHPGRCRRWVSGRVLDRLLKGPRRTSERATSRCGSPCQVRTVPGSRSWPAWRRSRRVRALSQAPGHDPHADERAARGPASRFSAPRRTVRRVRRSVPGSSLELLADLAVLLTADLATCVAAVEFLACRALRGGLPRLR